jgi:hypothetical protein
MSDVSIHLKLNNVGCPKEEQVFTNDGSNRYVGFFQNDFGEALIFVQEKGQAEASLYHADMEWEPQKINHPVDIPIILSEEERYWLAACWEASKFIRESKS